MDRSPLHRDVTRLKVVHRQRVNRQGDAEPPPTTAPKVTPVTAENAARGWQGLLDTEYESIVIASWMTAAMSRLGAPLDLIGAFGRVVEDEIRHVDVCAEMVERFGGSPTLVRGPLPPLPTSLERGTEPELETVCGLVGFFCVFELLSGYVFYEALERCGDDLPRWAVGEIYRDEAFHGAFGFEAARFFVADWSEAWRTRLARHAEAEVQRFARRLEPGARLGAAGEVAALENLGLLSPSRILPVFHTGVEKELIPRLKELGIPVEIQIVAS